MTHREVLYELRQAARRLGEGKIGLHEWHRQVVELLRQRGRGKPPARSFIRLEAGKMGTELGAGFGDRPAGR